MKVILSNQTSINSKSASPDKTGEAAMLAGARFRTAKVIGEPDIYIATMFNEMDKLLDSATYAKNVLGQTEEQIAQELNRRHPSSRMECQTVLRVDSISLTTLKQKTNEYGRRGSYNQHNTARFGVSWVVLPKPLVEQVEDISELTIISLQVGSVLLPEKVAESLFGSKNNGKMDKGAEDAGFTTALIREYGSHTFIQVNYNPKAMGRREFVKKKREAENRMRGAFTKETMRGLYKLLSPSSWPSEHPHYNTVSSIDVDAQGGWGTYRKAKDIESGPLMKILDLNLKLWNQPWWRKEETNRSYWSAPRQLPTLLKDALPFIHEVERKARRYREKLKEEIAAEYLKHEARCQRYREAKEEILATLRFEDEGGALLPDTEKQDWRLKKVLNPAWVKDPDDEPKWIEKRTDYTEYESTWPKTIRSVWVFWFGESNKGDHEEPKSYGNETQWLADQFKRRYEHTTACTDLQLCRWLRQEARIAKIEVPKPPKIPVSAAELKRRAKARRKARREAARERRKRRRTQTTQEVHPDVGSDVRLDDNGPGCSRLSA
jgi:hypothetical protein